MKKVVVIGSNSFSGSHFVDALLRKTNFDVIGISRSNEKKDIFLPYKGHSEKKFNFFQLDINKNLEEIVELIEREKAEYVVNYASQGMVGESWKTPEHWFRTNCLGTVNLTNRLKDMPWIERYIHISTNEVYGPCKDVCEDAPLNPTTPYATSKAAADRFIQNLVNQFNFPANIVRSTNVYGPCQQLFRIIPRSIIYLKMDKKIQLHGGGKAVKSFLHIKDNCYGTLQIMQSGKSGGIYNLSPSTGHSIKEIVKKICEKTGNNFELCTEVVEERIGQDSEYVLNSNKARRELNWNPAIDIDKGLDECIQWVNNNWEIISSEPLDYIHME